MDRKTIVRNVMTNKFYVFVNELSLEDNIINVVIEKENQMSQLTNDELRAKVKEKADIHTDISKKTGKRFAYSLNYDLYAQEQLL